MTAKPVVRCAIYTRKSSEEGLDQEFNSLDAQHEACTAYVASQRHEGWKLVPDRYDDGGISGGTLERPALQRLLADIDAGRIGMIVVYKIDRLTRSLSDFAKLVDRFDAAGCSFVSVTQAFNTSTSMGRLTLNVLLSFAQFEREVTAERIRDKVAASKKKGMWMGGVVPLGYDSHPDPTRRELVLNPTEAPIVKMLFELYEQHGSLRLVEDEAARRGFRSKRQTFSTGRTIGDGHLSRGQIHYLLTNPTYLGKIRHREKIWPGLHPAIISQDLWDTVQARLQATRARPRTRFRSGDNPEGVTPASLLTGKLRDEACDRLTPTHTTRHGKRLRYYVSNRLLTGAVEDASGWRLPAPALEQAVIRILADHIADCALGHRILREPNSSQAMAVSERAIALADRLRSGDATTARDLISSGQMAAGTISIELASEPLAIALRLSEPGIDPAILKLSAPFGTRRRGVETRLVAGTQVAAADHTLLKALARAHRWAGELRQGTLLSAIAMRDGHSDSFVRVRMQLGFLSPKIQMAIVTGTQPPELCLERIVRNGVPLDWREQERLFGFRR